MKKWLNRNRSRLTDWIVGAILGAILGGSISWFTTWHYTGRKDPLYAVSDSYLYVNSGKDQELKILWKGQKIERAYLTFVALWNNGNQRIDFTDNPSGEPIVIEPDKPVHILYAKADSAWPGLGFRANLNDDIAKGERIHITWESDEALEQDRGGVVRIIYEAASSTDFHVRGRVKGTLEDFRRSSSKPDLDRRGILYLEAIGIIIAVGFLIVGLLTYFLNNRDARKTWQRVHRCATVEDYVKSTRNGSDLIFPAGMVVLGVLICILGWRYSQSPAIKQHLFCKFV